MGESRFMRAAKSRAARMGFPGCYAFEGDQQPVTKLSDDGQDLVVDVEATEALYAEDISGGK